MSITRKTVLEPITTDNLAEAVRIAVRPDQERFVAPVVQSLAEAYTQPDVAWPRLVRDEGRPVAFVMGAFDPTSEIDFFRAGIWRLNVAAESQGQGYGRVAVEAVAEEARARGQQRITVLWVPGDAGPERFYLRLGFRPTGQVLEDQVVGELLL
ncbi:GNAT family N-acetyltransferase [Actinotalea ferrariae]|uniref:GNAT family N-acetyltransferase n=1 Tax=Actinotalea ferrariae TaxID=1386098 RepID=UPI001C8CBD79|nr:GNAT family N-acetyltransferase [Actinotalea ferrariae]MBX9246819.1 GNAT family N-acetyltransferase [Actinotalea ferrariae]